MRVRRKNLGLVLQNFGTEKHEIAVCKSLCVDMGVKWKEGVHGVCSAVAVPDLRETTVGMTSCRNMCARAVCILPKG
jgi:hypothetical protein